MQGLSAKTWPCEVHVVITEHVHRFCPRYRASAIEPVGFKDQAVRADASTPWLPRRRLVPNLRCRSWRIPCALPSDLSQFGFQC
jgi:hypothetical protein